MNLEWPLYLPSLAGDALIDVAAVLFLLFDGRVAGISRIVESLLGSRTAMTATNVAFGLGLLFGPWAYMALAGHEPAVHIQNSWLLLGAAGLLVGFGTRLGVGWGLAGFSPGPAIASLTLLFGGGLLFAAAMIAGMTLYRLVPSKPSQIPS
jgi:hypothetical protein